MTQTNSGPDSRSKAVNAPILYQEEKNKQPAQHLGRTQSKLAVGQVTCVALS